MRSALRVGLLVGLLSIGTAALAPAPAEPLSLRWARTAAAHPWRMGLALFLIDLGLVGTGSGRSGTTEAPTSARDRGRSKLR
jgi:hypothetical protein